MFDATVAALRRAGESHALIALLADDIIVRSPIAATGFVSWI
jgi:hypothetical protein